MFSERTSVGLDVHARSTAWALDCEAGEVFNERLVANADDVVAWVALPLPKTSSALVGAGVRGALARFPVGTAT